MNTSHDSHESPKLMEIIGPEAHLIARTTGITPPNATAKYTKEEEKNAKNGDQARQFSQ